MQSSEAEERKISPLDSPRLPPPVAKIALAQCLALPEDEDDDAPLHAALERLGGVEVSTPHWDDATHDWTQYALVIPRMTWDYQVGWHCSSLVTNLPTPLSHPSTRHLAS